MVEGAIFRSFRQLRPRAAPPGLYDRVLQHVERPLLMAAPCHPRQPDPRGRPLGVNRNTLRKKIRDLDIRYPHAGSLEVQPALRRTITGGFFHNLTPATEVLSKLSRNATLQVISGDRLLMKAICVGEHHISEC